MNEITDYLLIGFMVITLLVAFKSIVEIFAHSKQHEINDRDW